MKIVVRVFEFCFQLIPTLISNRALPLFGVEPTWKTFSFIFIVQCASYIIISRSLPFIYQERKLLRKQIHAEDAFTIPIFILFSGFAIGQTANFYLPGLPNGFSPSLAGFLVFSQTVMVLEIVLFFILRDLGLIHRPNKNNPLT